MVSKLVFLMIIGACLAYPYPDDQPPYPLPPAGGIPLEESSLNGQEPIPMASEPNGDILPASEEALAQVIPTKPEESDLKTDATYWFRRSYYPRYYYKSYYRPRSFSFYYTPYWRYW